MANVVNKITNTFIQLLCSNKMETLEQKKLIPKELMILSSKLPYVHTEYHNFLGNTT